MAQILTGTPVVGGLAHGPALWPGERPDHSPEKLGVGVEIAEERRADEVTRFATAAGAVAARLSAAGWALAVANSSSFR